MRFLAGPYDTEPEAAAAAGAIEADCPQFRAKTFVWHLSTLSESTAGSSSQEDRLPSA
jgi:hypothetical protein